MTEGTEEPLADSRNVPALLAALRARQRSCTVVVTGSPGGSIHVRDGLVVAMETPGAPGIEGLLLRSGRIGEQEWSAVRASDTTHEHLAAELVTQGLVGAGELEVISLGALFDAAFALSLAVPDSWEVSDPVPTLYRNAGVTPSDSSARCPGASTSLPGSPVRSPLSPAPVSSRRPPHTSPNPSTDFRPGTEPSWPPRTDAGRRGTSPSPSAGASSPSCSTYDTCWTGASSYRTHPRRTAGRAPHHASHPPR